MDELLAAAERLADLGSWSLQIPTMDWMWSDGLYRLHGLDPAADEPDFDLLLQTIHPADRERVAAAVGGALKDDGGREIVAGYRVVLPDGSMRYLRALGRIERGEPGGDACWFGVVQDVSNQLAAERDIHTRYAVTQALREWESFDDGVVGLLRRMGTALDCAAGVLWTCDPRRDRIEVRALWIAHDADLGAFADITPDLTFRRGEGVPGQVWESGEPWFSPDVAADPAFVRADAAAKSGLRSALAFAARTEERGTVAVLSFYSVDRREPTERLVRTLSGIGAELGRFLERRRADLEPGPLSARELEVLKLASEGLSGPKIANRLIVSPSTVKTHFENIYDKLGVSDRGGAVAHALRLGLIE